jgi:hypothetical protein
VIVFESCSRLPDDIYGFRISQLGDSLRVIAVDTYCISSPFWYIVLIKIWQPWSCLILHGSVRSFVEAVRALFFRARVGLGIHTLGLGFAGLKTIN